MSDSLQMLMCGPCFQVDLKDKWRNLERQGVVGPADAGPAALGGGGQPGQQPDGSVMAPDGQQPLDVQQHLDHQQQQHVRDAPALIGTPTSLPDLSLVF